MTDVERLSEDEIAELNTRYEKASPEELIDWACKRWGDSLVFACSFSVEDITLIDMAVAMKHKPRVVALDTGRLPEATFRIMENVRERYGLSIEVMFPDAADVGKLLKEKGLFSFRNSVEERQECCRIRKVEPLKRALKGAGAWVTGRRRDQAVTRGSLGKVEFDSLYGGIAKINPLTDWTETQVQEYAKSHKIPQHEFYQAGYRSIGCDCCTRATRPGESERDGRWWWENPDRKECGIHR